MEKIMIFDGKMKNKLGMMFFLPGTLLFIIFIYYLFMLSPLTRGPIEPGSIMTYTLRYYNVMLVMLSIFGVISAGILIYALVVLTRLKNLTSGVKILWVLLLSVAVPVSLILFWIFVINKEPKYVAIYPNID